jgi:hypothetical protein
MSIILGVVFFIIICMGGSAGYKQRMKDDRKSKENAKNIFKKKAVKLFDQYQQQLDWIDNK